MAAFRPDWALLRYQLAYALPFGMAVLVEIVQTSLPQYAVSHLFDPATFAIFAVGCLQIPLVDFAASPTSDVMMVKMQERLAERRKQAVVEIWHDTTWKLALLFFPLAAFLMVDAREFIVFLFTRRYIASAPIFMVWSAMILLTTLQVDGVMRVFAQTRFLLVLNLMRLAIIAGLIRWSLAEFGLAGRCFGHSAGNAPLQGRSIDPDAETACDQRLQSAAVARPGRLAGCVGVWSGGGSRRQIADPCRPAPVDYGDGPAFACTYAGLVWRFDLLNESERLAIAGWVRRTRIATGLALDYEKG